MAISKLILNGEVQMDVTSDTVTAGSMLSGTTATKNDGTKATGTIASKSSSDLTVSGATVTAPAGYYSASASKSVTTMTLPTTTSTSATSGYTSKATLDRSTSDRYLNIAPGYNSTGGYYKINKVADGSVTAPSSISGTSATVSTGTNTLTLTKSVSVTPNVTTAGYISSGTAGNASVSLTANVTTKAAATITPSTSAQEIAAGTYLTGKQTISAMPSGTAGTPTATKGSVSNHAVSVTPSVTNTTGYITGGIKTGTAVTVSASELVSGTKSITENGTSDVTNYASVNINVSGGGGEPASKKQINFIDYDGSIVESYTKAEWQSVSSLPSNPSHSGLTAQGWNWTKAQIDAQLTAIPNGDVWIGQMYITDDGKTRIYIRLEEGRLHPYLGICPNGTVVVDWGDNSATSTLTGTSLTTVRHVDHTYASGGDYMITLTVSSGSFALYGVSNTSHILKKNDSSTANIHRVYANAIQKIELGNNVRIDQYAFQYCYSLKNVTIPSGVTSIGMYAFSYCYQLTNVTIPSGVTSIDEYAFQYCRALASIAIPNGVTSIGTYAFQYCYELKNVTIPSGVTSIGIYAFRDCYSLASITIPSSVTSIGNYTFNSCYALTNITMPSGVTSIGNYVFQYCYSLASITIPSSVTSIGTYAFNSCYGMAEYHFMSTTPPTLANTNAFTNIQSDCVIYVPSASLANYQTTSVWSTYASYMQGE